MTTWQQQIEAMLEVNGEDPAAIEASEFLPEDLEGVYQHDLYNMVEKSVWTKGYIYTFIFNGVYRVLRVARNPSALMPRTKPGEVMVTVKIQERWERTVEFPIERQRTSEHMIAFEARCLNRAEDQWVEDSDQLEFIEDLHRNTWTVKVEE